MKKWLLVAALGAVVATAGLATAGSPPGPAQDRVYGGGSFAGGGTCSDGATPFCPALSREFSILAEANPDGKGAYGSFRYGVPQAGQTLVVGRVTCLTVRGNDAIAGGVIVEHPDPAFVGGSFAMLFRDLADAGSSTRDRVSAGFVDFPSAPPADCSQLDSNAFDSGYFALTTGDVAVEDR